MKEITNYEDQPIFALPMSVIGPNVIIEFLSVKEKALSDFIDLEKNKYGHKAEMLKFDDPRQKENRAFNLFTQTEEHPFQAVIIGVGDVAIKEYRLAVGDIIYGGVGLLLSRSIMQVNGVTYPVIGINSIFAVVGNVNLKELKIESLNI